MTVLELVKELNKYDPNAEVKIWAFENGKVSVGTINETFPRINSVIIAIEVEEI